jgi:argininosuccinate lyase
MLNDVTERGERFGRVKKPTAPQLTDLLTHRDHPTPFDVASYYGQMLIHRAHVIMLVEQSIITQQEGATILKGLKDVDQAAKNDRQLTSYMSTETALIERIGVLGGKMHIGRSRNDLGAAQRRIFYRDRIERVIDAVLLYRKALLNKAEAHVDTVMPGYTHWRQAQPVTLGHYLLAHVDAAGRCIESLETAYAHANLNALGAAALAGTGWPINRLRTMELLGFDAVCENSYDCVAAYDFIVEFASVLTIHMSNMSRLAEDLQIWSSDEFAMVDLDEAYAGTSSIMPQKKNPSALEAIKRFAAESIGALLTLLASLKGISYTNIGDRATLEPVIVETAIDSTKVMGGVVTTLVPFKETMLRRAAQGFSTMTELADVIVRKFNISFRQAHDIIAETTTQALAEGKFANQITVDMIKDAALKHLGRQLDVTNKELQLAVDPLENVKRRKVLGGPAPEEVKRMINDRRNRINIETARHVERLEKVRKAYAALDSAENKILQAIS